MYTLTLSLQVSEITVKAKEAVEAASGSVRKVYYNQLRCLRCSSLSGLKSKVDCCQKSLDLPQNNVTRLIALADYPPQLSPFHFQLKKRSDLSIFMLDDIAGLNLVPA